MLKKIRLYGILAKKFGKEFRLDVENTREAMRALSVQVPGFEHFMLHAHEQGLEFAVFQDKQNISETELDMSTSAKVIKVVPRVKGAGGAVQTILGAVMIAAAFITGGTSIAAWGALQGALFGAGVGMMVGGVAQMLMPKVDTTQDQNEDGNKANKGFGGAVTTIAQGNPVPVLYGQREVGGFIASAGQYPEDLM
ncbi:MULTISPECIES: tail assembly protein [Acinetobacter]|uniref:tail assembly protein n=1 Tax=Acinetobacter TaxID=469 RepID=UPI00044BE8F9|nr:MULTISPECIES: tail assembly protein [Acinetobacter]EXC34370.1 bacteriophage lambda tail assembly I family protein [Acinetobacter sp. 869535]MCK4095391.1 tail assembly protein [Acinetobacter radioresistens]